MEAAIVIPRDDDDLGAGDRTLSPPSRHHANHLIGQADRRMEQIAHNHDASGVHARHRRGEAVKVRLQNLARLAAACGDCPERTTLARELDRAR
ncbi:hypothetical protein J4558_15410 [Leptolyngbya sp. 15MV]|nr:hypothetical protein J4558_15410 [Leptolyngbya sp. 15MV]